MNSDLWIPQFSQQKNPSRRCPKGHNILAQGIALGIYQRNSLALKGNAVQHF